jgi:hypothetical protein
MTRDRVGRLCEEMGRAQMGDARVSASSAVDHLVSIVEDISIGAFENERGR